MKRKFFSATILFATVLWTARFFAAPADFSRLEISGVKNFYVANGETPDYFNGVFTAGGVGETEIKTFPEDLDTTVWGTREITYVATDKAGNKATAACYLKIGGPASAGDLDSQLANILASITNDSMSKREKALKIYNWTTTNIRYGGATDKSSIYDGASQALLSRRGDCFAFYAVSTLLMNRAGIDNIGCQRLGGSTRHFWSMINTGDGWFFFDSTPHTDNGDNFMMANSQREYYSAKRGGIYYRYDASTYPSPVF